MRRAARDRQASTSCGLQWTNAPMCCANRDTKFSDTARLLFSLFELPALI
jgi:hypothetical protein